MAVCAHLHIFNERVRLLIFEAKPLGSINLETNETFKHDGSRPQLILDPIFGSKPGEAASSKELDPRREPLMLLTAGDCHTVCLCAESKHLATPSVLHRVGVLLLSQVPSPPGLVSCTCPQCRPVSYMISRPTSPQVAWQFNESVARLAQNTASSSHPASPPSAASLTIPTKLVMLPDYSKPPPPDSVLLRLIDPWKDAVIGLELCLILCRQASCLLPLNV